MITAGDFVLFRFPQADLERGKLRPALLLRNIPNEYNDWLVCMVSTQLHQQIKDLEIVISTTDRDFAATGLKTDSLIRSSRLAVVGDDIFEGRLGSLTPAKLQEIRKRLSSWLLNDEAGLPSESR